MASHEILILENYKKLPVFIQDSLFCLGFNLIEAIMK